MHAGNGLFMKKDNIALIGMMGSGKTTIAGELHKRLPGYTLVDIDSEIEKGSGKKISEIFLKFGEARFRELEREKIKKFTALTHQIIAPGGGAFEDEGNRKKLLEHSTVIYLKASPEEIYKRIKQETHRPLLAKNFSVERIAVLSAGRAVNYEKADFTIDTDNKTPYDIVNEILGVLNG